MEIQIGNQLIGQRHPVYFIAEIGANHDGELERAKDLVHLAVEAGANAVKFQNFRAPQIVSDFGFKNLGSQLSHQQSWKKTVFEVYESASIPLEWTMELGELCDELNVQYFSSPYDFDAVNSLASFFPAIKIGSGDITWLEIISLIASKNKPILLATGASTIGDVQRAVEVILKKNNQLVLMQCNTNYTANKENFRHIHLNVLKTYATLYPDVILGLSDHTSGHSTTLGAVALGAKVIEKHFTDDTQRDGPDHSFAMEPQDFKDMILRTRELEAALGSSQKFIASNEKDTVILQRRCVRASRNMNAGEILSREDLDILRPAPPNSILPYNIDLVLGCRVNEHIEKGDIITWKKVTPRE